MSKNKVCVIYAIFFVVVGFTATALAKTKSPTGTIATKSCDQKHDVCIDYCIKAKKDGKELKACSEGCAGEYLKCKRAAKRQVTPDSTAPEVNTIGQ
jgi:hypothetical protein